MATASVVELAPKSTPGSAPRRRAPAELPATGAIILQFPRRQTTEELVREWVVLDAKVHPDMFPGGLPRNLERDVQRWMQVFAYCQETMARKWREDIAIWKAMLAQGMTYVGPLNDPATAKRCAEYHAHWYGEPEEGHEAWLPWLAQKAADTGHARDGGAPLRNLRKEFRSDRHPNQ